MLDFAFKNIMRQRTRTILTTLGILIGIGAIVALGSIAEGLDKAIQDGLELMAGKITVMEAGTGIFGMGGEFDDTDVDAISAISGVKEALPIIYHADSISFSGPSWVAVGIEPDKMDYLYGENREFEEGRPIDEGETDVAVIGYSIAQRYDVQIGDTWEIKEDEYEVIGILEETSIADIDTSISVPFEDLQETLDTETYQMIYVIPDDVKDTEQIAEEIEDTDDDYSALTSQDLARQAGAIVDQVRIFTFGIGAIAAIVGGLGVMNTMIMSVMERRREIGVMKAVGATNRMVLQQIITESAMISLLGGAGGILLGLLGAIALSVYIGGGQISATVTPGLALTGLSFALFLGIVGGLYPARKAAGVDPVEALRYE
jgi:putative ABC transport system permease protein